ncbi:MerR family transcriptional regulator [Sphingopyxis sp. JAI128]|uniref:MerR family transcriptional regulator n=1 Tax=Sphingopyxis sp. JAI128 TaxID=2723066 RepID=UPI001621844C|nr:MerR family transcriptional regulator [Sphingopyxis sp. JAI128]
MARYKVSELAAIARISVRTLHHYHEIGLLVPADVGPNGYRYYDREQVLRLQQILIYRELGMPLAEIARALDAPDFDRLQTLREQRRRISENMSRGARILATIDRTIANLEGKHIMNDEELYTGVVDPAKQAEYEKWLIDKYGPDISKDIAEGHERWDDAAPAEVESRMRELSAIEQELAEQMQKGVAPDDALLDPFIERHRAWVEGMSGPSLPSAYAGLADVYEHPDFEARYEAIATGFGAFLRAAMRAWAARQ